MSKIPLPPPSKKSEGKKKIEFDNPEKYQTKQKLHQEIRQTLLDLRNSLLYANHREMVMDFIGVINPGSMGGDVTRLPYESQGPKARTASKSECLFALISYIIQEYWAYCAGELTALSTISSGTKLLQQITKNGLKQYQVVGNVRDGFSLEKI
jgi:hypothetical protein